MHEQKEYREQSDYFLNNDSLPLPSSPYSLDLFEPLSNFHTEYRYDDGFETQQLKFGSQMLNIDHRATQFNNQDVQHLEKSMKRQLQEDSFCEMKNLSKQESLLDQKCAQKMQGRSKHESQSSQQAKILCCKKNEEKVFKQQKLKGRYRKNTNVPKILIRIYMKYFQKLSKSKANSFVRSHYAEMKRKLDEHKTNNYKILDLLELMGVRSSSLGQEESLANRETMSRIIKQSLKKEIILNNFVKGNQMSYMMALKIYGLRCRCKALTQRVKIL